MGDLFLGSGSHEIYMAYHQVGHAAKTFKLPQLFLLCVSISLRKREKLIFFTQVKRSFLKEIEFFVTDIKGVPFDISDKEFNFF